MAFMEFKPTWNSEHLDKEIKYFFKERIGRICFMRMMYEQFKIFTPNYENNANVYAEQARRSVGLEMYNLAKDIDVKKVNLADKEYREMIELSAEKAKKEASKDE